MGGGAAVAGLRSLDAAARRALGRKSRRPPRPQIMFTLAGLQPPAGGQSPPNSRVSRCTTYSPLPQAGSSAA